MVCSILSSCVMNCWTCNHFDLFNWSSRYEKYLNKMYCFSKMFILMTYWYSWCLSPSVWCFILPWQPAPPCFQGFGRIGRTRRPAVGGFALAGSCCTRWSTTRPCWAPGSTSRHGGLQRAPWMGPPTTAPRKAARGRPAWLLQSQSNPLPPQQTKIKLIEIPNL